MHVRYIHLKIYVADETLIVDSYYSSYSYFAALALGFVS
jgi:hypothetical protein